jgi:lipoprotein LprG
MRLRSLAAGVTLLFALTACSGGASGSAAPAPATPADRLAAAKAAMDKAASVHLVLSSRDVPPAADGVLGADGVGTHAPAFKGRLDARISGVQAAVDVVSVGSTLYLKLPFTSRFVRTDPKTYQAPDPATLFATDGGISSLLTRTTGPRLGDRTRSGSTVLQTVTGSLPGRDIAGLLAIGEPAATFGVTYGLTDPGNELRTVTLTGPFFPGSTSTYALTLDRYGDPVEIRQP